MTEQEAKDLGKRIATQVADPMNRLLTLVEQLTDRVEILERERRHRPRRPVTLDAVLAKAADDLDRLIARELEARELRMRADLAASGPEDEEALDRPPDPDAAWRRVTVEEVIEMERDRFQTWRAETLDTLRRALLDELGRGSTCTPNTPPTL